MNEAPSDKPRCEMRRCPFCRSDRTKITAVDAAEPPWFTGYCQDCGGEGPVAVSREIATRYWNGGFGDDARALSGDQTP